MATDKGVREDIPMSEVKVLEQAEPSPSQPPLNPDYELEIQPASAADRLTLDEGPIVLQRPKDLGADSVRDLEDWFKVVIGRMKRKAGISDDE